MAIMLLQHFLMICYALSIDTPHRPASTTFASAATHCVEDGDKGSLLGMLCNSILQLPHVPVSNSQRSALQKEARNGRKKRGETSLQPGIPYLSRKVGLSASIRFEPTDW